MMILFIQSMIIQAVSSGETSGFTSHSVNRASSLPAAGRMSSAVAVSRDYWEQRTFSFFQQLLPESEILPSCILSSAQTCSVLSSPAQPCLTLPWSTQPYKSYPVLPSPPDFCPACVSLPTPVQHSTAQPRFALLSTVWFCPICLAQLSPAQTSSCSAQSCPASPAWPSPAQPCLGLVQDYPLSPQTQRKPLFSKISYSLSKAMFGDIIRNSPKKPTTIVRTLSRTLFTIGILFMEILGRCFSLDSIIAIVLLN